MEKAEEQALADLYSPQLRAAGCVYAEEEAALIAGAAASPPEAEELLRRRLAGQPLEYVLGWAGFCGLRIAVVPGVFIPRRRTEFLAGAAVTAARTLPSPVVLDLCCGSGAISAVLAAAMPEAELHAADRSPEAVACARGNLAGRAAVWEGDLFSALPDRLRGHLNVVVANAPYVPTEEMGFLPQEARRYEPRLSLDGGAGGLAVLRAIAAAAPAWLAAGGQLLLECSEEQAPRLSPELAAAGFTAAIRRNEDAGATILCGVLG
ncbi:putative protein N(5)-glutamine methyltransferase [Arthrobacter sp. zg-Y916]|uniref:putative protein N(5)-glutamine methyltransferase n=1 Tax=Arthrobacter sp. zg-Y916 TaxID=2894190 RepID=UPI001E39C24F|nr:putative protein N(5)-glutamine methyltransferase [Arthrobacter sp. zg-Y916]MCC9193346.1 putative protein N(5)-glutamine methyltransferase [Arthrobacter sp. zg-Y916]